MGRHEKVEKETESELKGRLGARLSHKTCGTRHNLDEPLEIVTEAILSHKIER